MEITPAKVIVPLYVGIAIGAATLFIKYTNEITMGKSISQVAGMGIQLGTQAAEGLVNKGLGLLFAGPERKAQLKTAKGLQDLQIAGNKEMTDYNMSKQLQMWKDTSYGAQKEQMEKAGINPALMYGMSGGGGQTTGSAGASVGGQSAGVPEGDTKGMGLQGVLLQAQIDNINADTKAKEQAAYDSAAAAEGKVLQNSWESWIMNRDEYGNPLEKTGDELSNWSQSIKARQVIENFIFQRVGANLNIAKNDREKLLNDAAIKKIAEEIDLLKKKGLTETEVMENLKKEGKLKDAEIAWNELNLEPGNFGKFLTNIIKLAFK